MGKPNKEQDEQKGVQQGAKKDGFAQTVDKHIQKFEPYFRFTGVILLSCDVQSTGTNTWKLTGCVNAGLTAEKFKNDATASYSTRNQDAHPTDDQLQEMAEEWHNVLHKLDIATTLCHMSVSLPCTLIG